MREYTVLHLFCGMGGGALGFQQADVHWRGIRARFRTLAGIDVDPEACQDFEALTGARAVRMDLFDRDQYRAWHGHEPPADWREATPQDVREAAGEPPDVVFLSPPCKGFSALLGASRAATAKYQALNRLTLRGVFLTLEAFRDDPPGLILLENVPGILQRGTQFLSEIKRMLWAYGYVTHDSLHDAGEYGSLAQHRRRYLLVARLPRKVPVWLYQPPRERVRAIGEELGRLPLPDDPAGGPMHRLPRLHWKTWVRLALIPAGGDWRDLQDIDISKYRITPEANGVYTNKYRVLRWDEPANTVTGSDRIGSGAPALADPRYPDARGQTFHGSPGLMRILKWEEPSGTVTGSVSVTGSNAAGAVADPRVPPHWHGFLRVAPWDRPAAVVTANASVTRSNAMAAVADPRVRGLEGAADPKGLGGYDSKFRVQAWDRPSRTVTSDYYVGSGAPSVADPRGEHYANSYRVTPWEEPAGTVTSGHAPSNGGCVVADPRLGYTPRNGAFRVGPWDKPATTVIGSASVRGSNGIAAVADPRLSCAPRNGVMGVTAWDQPSATVIAAGDVHATRAAVADPRIPADNERPDPPPVIIALDGTWHRPLTTLELAVLQGFPAFLPDGRPLTLAGNAEARWRERIGNAVPPPTARAIAEQMLLTLLRSAEGVWEASPTPVWVMPEPTDLDLLPAYVGANRSCTESLIGR